MLQEIGGKLKLIRKLIGYHVVEGNFSLFYNATTKVDQFSLIDTTLMQLIFLIIEVWPHRWNYHTSKYIADNERFRKLSRLIFLLTLNWMKFVYFQFHFYKCINRKIIYCLV